VNGANGTSGTSGVNGANGTSGTSGTSGTRGTSGTSGVNGANGTSGTSGVNGANGTSGTSGVNGANGTSGTSGVNGAAGSSGTSGTSGTRGTSGSSGINGANGTSGTSGTTGTSGTRGTSGTSGINGANGTNGTSPVVGGSDNQVLTSDGSGGINAEANCIFDASEYTFIAGASISPGDYVVSNGVTSVLSDLDQWGFFSNYNVTGEIMFKQTSNAAFNKGDIIYLRSDNKWDFAKGSPGAVSTNMLGIALNDTTGADEFVTVLLKGFVSSVNVLDDTADAGAPMYLSSVSGQITDVAPTGTPSTVRIVGYTYKNTNDQGFGLYILRFDPDSTWIDN
jgi:hypothetical protein